MSSLEDMNLRLNYRGGSRQEDRMIADKLKSLKKALLYSYQAATAQLKDGRQFRCLINRNKLKEDYEDKIISIPFEDICINKPGRVGKTTEGFETIGMKVGDVFTWVETQTDWIVILQILEEDAYFRAEIRKCNYEIDINGTSYKGYIRRYEDDIEWHTKKNVSWNDIDFDIVLYIEDAEELREYFHRFVIVTIDGKPWEVQTVDGLTTAGVLKVRLKETYQNSIEKAMQREKEASIKKIEKDEEDFFNEENQQDLEPYIEGENIVYPYDQKQYKIKNIDGGNWEIDNPKKAIITYQTDEYVNITIITGRSGEFNLIYRKTDIQAEIKMNIKIKSL